MKFTENDVTNDMAFLFACLTAALAALAIISVGLAVIAVFDRQWVSAVIEALLAVALGRVAVQAFRRGRKYREGGR